jgi:two-component system LytT family sensor kinase
MKKFWKYVFPGLYGLLIYFTIRLLADSVSGMKFWQRSWVLNSIEMSTCIIMGFVAIAVYKRLFRYFDRVQPGSFSYKKIAKELGWVILANAIIVNTFATPMAALTDDGLQWEDIVDINVIPLLYVLIYYGIARSNTFLRAWVTGKLQLEKLTNDKLQTELKFLKAQYHPHFLFNALNTIYFQMDENVAEAKKSIEKFSELLRYQLYDQQQTVSVTQEIQYLENFIQLQKTRASEKLQLDVRFDQKLNGQAVYPLLFLPLVENAFKYVGGDYQLSIYAALTPKGLQFTVINSMTDETEQRKEAGIGLENLKRRLELLYPGKHVFNTEKKEGKFMAALQLDFLEVVQPQN